MHCITALLRKAVRTAKLLQSRQLTKNVDGCQDLCKKSQPPIATKGKSDHVCRVPETESAHEQCCT